MDKFLVYGSLDFGKIIRDFIDHIKGEGGVPQTVCTDNIKSLVMVHAAIESAETGKKVKIEI